MVHYSLRVLSVGDDHNPTCLQLEHGGVKVMLDLGVDPSIESKKFQFSQEDPDLAIITHAHRGHGGGLIFALREWQHCQYYCTTPTLNILEASYFVPENHENNSNIDGELTEYWFSIIGKKVKTLEAQQRTSIKLENESIDISFIPCGHLYGAIAPLITWNGKRILYLGDWSDNPFSGNPGLKMPDNCAPDVVILNTFISRPSRLPSRDPLEVIRNLEFRNVLFPVQGIGVVQEMLAMFSDDGVDYSSTRFIMDIFSYKVSQLFPCTHEFFARLTSHTMRKDDKWVSFTPQNFKKNLYLCGTASLWEGTPSNKIAKQIINESDSFIGLTRDVDNNSPADILANWSVDRSEMNERKVLSCFGTDVLSKIAEINIPQRKNGDESIAGLLKDLCPKKVLIIGKGAPDFIADNYVAPVNVLHEGDIGEF